MNRCRALIFFAVSALTSLVTGCSDDASKEKEAQPASGYVLGSVTVGPGGRTTYLQVLPSLDVAEVNNRNAIEVSGNGTYLIAGRHLFLGMAEEPTWIRYSPNADGKLEESGRISFANQGLSRIDFGNMVVSDRNAVSLSTEQRVAIFWDPEELTILGTLELPHLAVEGYDVEVYTPTVHEGRLYIPGRWANWDTFSILPKVSLTIVDPETRTIVGIAEDERCASGGRLAFDANGVGYVMGDGRSYSQQMFANAAGTTPPQNCLLRLQPGATSFDADYVRYIPSLTGGLESVSELNTARQGSGVAVTRMFYPGQLPANVTPTSFDFWQYPAFKLWRLQLGDEPTASAIDALPFGTVGFDGSTTEGKLYLGESPNYANSTVYEVDPETGSVTQRFTMTGIFYGLYRLN